MSRSTDGLDGYSTTGVWVAIADGRIVGPWNGKSTAEAFRRDAKALGFHFEIQQLWTPAEARAAKARSA